MSRRANDRVPAIIRSILWLGIPLLIIVTSVLAGQATATGPSDHLDDQQGVPSRLQQSPAQAGHLAYLPLQLQRSDPIEHKVRLDPVGQIGGASNAVAVAGRHAYIGVGPRLVVADISDPDAPEQVGQSEPMGVFVQDVSVAGGYAYVLASRSPGFGVSLAPSSVFVVDVANPSRPQVRGRLDIDDTAFDLEATAGYVYVGGSGFNTDRYGVVVIDVAEPTQPFESAFLDLGIAPFDLVLDGDRLLVAGPERDESEPGEGVLQLVDVSAPDSPTAGGRVALTRDELNHDNVSMAVHADQAYVVVGGYRVALVDISELMAPSLASNNVFDAQHGAQYVATMDGHAFVLGDDLHRLEVFELPADDEPPDTLPNPQAVATLLLSSRLDLYGYPALNPMVGRGGAVYLTRGWLGGMHIVRAADPTEPVSAGSLAAVGSAECITVAGDTLYAVDGARLSAIDITDPGDPKSAWQSGDIAAGGGGCDMAVDGEYLYVSSGGLEVFDISDAREPEQIDWLRSAGHTVSVADGHAYLAGTALSIVDIGTPGSSRQIGRLLPPQYSRYRDAWAVERTVYAASGSRGLRIIDAADPEHPVELGGIDTDGHAYRVVADGRNAYLIVHPLRPDGRAYVASYEVSTPTAPRELDRLYLPDNSWQFELHDDLLYLTGSGVGHRVVSVADPAALEEVGRHHAYGDWRQIRFDGEHAFVAGVMGGVHVLRVERED